MNLSYQHTQANQNQHLGGGKHLSPSQKVGYAEDGAPIEVTVPKEAGKIKGIRLSPEFGKSHYEAFDVGKMKPDGTYEIDLPDHLFNQFVTINIVCENETIKTYGCSHDACNGSYASGSGTIGLKIDYQSDFLYHMNNPSGEFMGSSGIKSWTSAQIGMMDINGVDQRTKEPITQTWPRGIGAKEPTGKRSMSTFGMDMMEEKVTDQSTLNRLRASCGGAYNCWEVILKAAILSGELSEEEVKKSYQEVIPQKVIGDDMSSNESVQRQKDWHKDLVSGLLIAKKLDKATLYKKGKVPNRGDIVFFNGLNHVMVATGKLSEDGSPEVLSFWTHPGKSTSIISTSFNQILSIFNNDMKIKDVEIRYAPASWLKK